MFVRLGFLLLLLSCAGVGGAQHVVKVFQNKRLPQDFIPVSVQKVKDQSQCENICFQRGASCIAGQFLPPKCKIFSQVPNNVANRLEQKNGSVFFLKRVNVARAGGVTCVASSTFSGYFSCTNAFDGIYLPGNHNEWASLYEPTGNWIQITFPALVNVERIKIWFRCNGREQNKIINFESAHGITQRFTRKCADTYSWKRCNVQNGEEFDLHGIITTFIKVTGEQKCTSNGHNPGMREIEVWGYYW